MKKIILTLLSISILSGCSSGDYTDIKQWMKKESATLKGKIDKLPPVKTFEPVTFSGKQNPFEFKEIISLKEVDQNKFAPDFNRRKEPLEYYSLDKLQFTGMLVRDKIAYAMIKNPDGTINYVSKGNYIGVNYGKIINIDDGVITLTETIKDVDGWLVRETKIEME